MRAFLETVLPDTGVYYVVVLTDKGPRHIACGTPVEMANVISGLSDHASSVHFALASYKAPYITDDDGRRRWRVRDNVDKCRVQAVDLDCGDAKDYTDKKHALAELKRFITESQLPAPTFIVDSGNGLHVYWAFDEAIDSERWIRNANAFKQICSEYNFRHDPTTTADISSLLRSPGTTNNKDPNNPKPVSILREGRVVSINAWEAAIQAATCEQVQYEDCQNDLTCGLEYPPSDPYKVASRCLTIRHMAETAGKDQTEPEWHHCVAVLVSTTADDELIHKWSCAHPGYTGDECQRKIEQIRSYGYKPTTCETMRGVSSHCKGCTIQCSSPIVLGFPERQEQVAQDEDAFSPPDEVKDWFRWKDDRLLAKSVETVDDEPVETWSYVASKFFAPEYIYRDKESNTYMIRFAVRENGELVDRDVPMAALASARGASSIAGELISRCGCIVTGAAQVGKYVTTWVDHINATRGVTEVSSHVGWQPDGSFVLGDTKYDPDGSRSQVFLTRGLKDYVEAMAPRGNPQQVIDALNHIYSLDHSENIHDTLVAQIMVIASFASPLLYLAAQEALGVILSVHSGTGTGKTTAAKVGLSFWGDPFAEGPIVIHNNTTDLALRTAAAFRRNVPMLYDEVTLSDLEYLRDLTYTYSSGRGKMQARADGGLRDTSKYNWCNFLYITANTSLVNKFASSPMDCTANLVRMIEFRMTHQHSATRASEVRRALEDVWQGAGTLGHQYAAYIAQHREYLARKINAVRDKLSTTLNLGSEARYWLLSAAAILTAFDVAKSLGFHRFDKQRFTRKLIDSIMHMTWMQSEAGTTLDDMLPKMINELMPGMIVTVNEGDRNKNAILAPGYSLPRTRITGRIILTTGDVYVPVSTVKEWCERSGVDYIQLSQELTRSSVLKNRSMRVYLAKGVPMKSPVVRCWHLNWGELSARLSIVDGGRADDEDKTG